MLSISSIAESFPPEWLYIDQSLFTWNFFRDDAVAPGEMGNPSQILPRNRIASFDEPQYLTKMISFICTDSGEDHFFQANVKRLLGINLDGVLLIENAGIVPHIPARCRFVITSGDFSLNGDKRPLLTTEGGSAEHMCKGRDHRMELDSRDMLQDLKLDVWASLTKDAICLKYELSKRQSKGDILERNFTLSLEILRLIANLPVLMTCQPCSHDVRDPRIMSKALVYCDGDRCITDIEVRVENDEEDGFGTTFWKDSNDDIWTLRIMMWDLIELDFDQEFNAGNTVFHLVSTSGNALAQWASASFLHPGDDDLVLVQGRTCLNCIADQCHGKGFRTVYIIGGE